MRDRLGGILLKGLLGNPILARFNLFFEVIIEDITPTPTPSATPSPTPSVPVSPPPLTPSPTPVVTLPPINIPLGGGGGARNDDKRTVKITIIYKGREWTSIHTFTASMLRVTINSIKRLNKAQETLNKIKVNVRKGIQNIKVKVTRND